MFKDTDEALARLEAELLRADEEDLAEEEYEEYDAYEEYDEEPEEEEEIVPPEYVYEDTRASTGSVIYQNYSNNYGKNLRNYASGYHAYNADSTDEDPETYSEELLEEEPEKGNTALIVIACLLSLTIAATVLIWTLMSRGIV